MVKINRKVFLSIISFFLLVILSGCSGGGGSSPDSIVDSAGIYKINIVNEGNGSVAKKPEKTKYKKDETVTLTAQPMRGWVFDHWEGSLRGNQNPSQVVVNDNLNIKSIFTFKKFLVNSTKPKNDSQDVAADIKYIYIYFNNELNIDGQQGAKAVSITPSPNFYPGWNVKDNYIRISLLSGILEFETTYKITIDNTKVWDIGGNSLEQPYTFSFTVEKDSYPPDKPSIGIATQSNTVTINWTTVYDNPSDGPRARKIDHYNIYRKIDNGNFVIINSVSESQTSYQDENLLPSAYYYYVTAVDQYGNESLPSNEVNATIN